VSGGGGSSGRSDRIASVATSVINAHAAHMLLPDNTKATHAQDNIRFRWSSRETMSAASSKP
jgi:hypothetical protein